MAQNYEVGNLEMNIKATASEATKALNDVLKKVAEMQKSFEGLSKAMKDSGDSSSKMANDIKKPKKEVEDLNKEVNKLGQETEKTGSKMRKAFNIGGAIFLGKKLAQAIDRGIGESTKMIQNYRLLETASKDYFNQAIKFQDTLTSAFGVNVKDAMGVQGYFNTLTSSLGMANKEANLMSENLTKLTYDLGALFGEDFESMYTKLQSGLIGQTKPLRSLGIDVTQQTIQGYLDNMGLDVLVQDLTQAEKVLLRYIAILDQSQLSHGMMAKSIEMPSIQIQILKQQVAELGMWLWNVFVGTIGKILPYINGFVMAIKEMIKAIAMLFGFELSNYSVGTVQTMQTGVGATQDLSKGLGNVGKSARKANKEMQKMRGLFGFDEIHNVQTPDKPSVPQAPSGGGVGGIAGGIPQGGIYDDLLAQMREYDNLMGDVRMKATDIRNKLLDWLGFLYDINAETGKLENLRWGGWKEMATSAKLMSLALGVIVGYKLNKKLADLVKTVKGSKMVTWAGKVAATASEVGLLQGAVTALTGVMKFLATTLGTVAGVAGLVIGVFKSWQFGRIIGETGKTDESMKGLAKSITLATSAGALLGSVVPGLGTVLGGLIGAVAGVTAAFLGWGFSKPIKEVSNFNDVSAETAKRMKPFEQSFKNLGVTLQEINWSESVVTQEDVATVESRLKEMGSYLNSEIVQEAEKTKEKLLKGDIFAGLDPNERNKLVNRLDKSAQIAQEKTNAMNAEILEIYKVASNERRSLTEEEKDRINELQTEMYEHAVKELSASQKDQDTILRNMKANSERLNAEQASQVVKSAKEARDGAVREAENRYAEEMRIIDQLWQRGEINKEQYDQMAKTAKTARDKDIAEAEKHHAEIIKEAKEHSGKYIDHIDWETGETLNMFQVTGKKIVKGAKELPLKLYEAWVDVMDGVREMVDNIIEKVTEFRDQWRQRWNDAKKDVKEWFNESVKPYFTVAKWRELFDNALKGLKQGWNTMLTWFKNKVKFPRPKIPDIKRPKISLPRLSVSGDFSIIPPRVPSFSVYWQKFAKGGFLDYPDGENGAFFANDREMIGKFDNGKTAVANNYQIVEGIKQGVKAGVVEAMNNATQQDSDGTINIYLDSKLIAREQKNRQLELEMTRG